jgi:carbon-monoxide dehydrogenase small subunit
MIPAVVADGWEITTSEGLADGDKLTPLQEAFVNEGAIQCGFCTPGMVVTATALLKENPDPSEDEIRDYLRGNYCRCTGYGAIIKAVKKGAEEMKKETKK